MAAAMNQAWRKAGTEGSRLTADDLAFIWVRDAGKCMYCGIEIDVMRASFDHEVPMSQDGPNTIGNLKLCCVTCQRSKYTKTPEEYAKWRALMVRCKTCGIMFKPRWADYVRGYGHYHSRKCSGAAAHA